MSRALILSVALATMLVAAPLLPAAKTHWAFRPPTRPSVPVVSPQAAAHNDIDYFIAAALGRKQLAMNPQADRATLIRRVSFDLTGLPPPPADVNAFRADPSPDAYQRMVERYLASPQYGVRWGKFWLDAAGYADSNGYFSADSDRPLAFRYRDYVIRSFNQDKPHDRFVFEQLAGDELAGYRPGEDVPPDKADLLTATHFLRNAPDGTGESDGNPDEVRIDRFTVLEGNLQNTMNCLLGITIQCARCHSHKLEPITHEEYYRLQAILYPAYRPERWVPPKDRVVVIATPAQREEYQRRNGQIDRQVKALQEGLATMAGPFHEQLVGERLKHLDAALRARVLDAFRTPKQKRSPEQSALLQQQVDPLKITQADLARRFAEYAAIQERVQQAMAARQKQRPGPLEQVSVLIDTDPNPPMHHLLLRGQHNSLGKAVQPGVPAVLCNRTNGYRLDPRPAHPSPVPQGKGKGETITTSTGRRTALARWVTSPENPLFARVMVNRIWQHHFGVGLVATPDNFGESGARASHPELLDYLAVEFMRSGWSGKAMHRLILQSAVYRQTSTPTAASLRRDPDNRLLSRFPFHRLDAEAVRDAMLAISGELDLVMGGPYVPTRRTEEGSVVVGESLAGAHRRSVYLQQRRTQVVTMLSLFDAPSVIATCSFRNTSTVPLQSLAMLNSEFVRARARAFARRLEQEAGPDADERLDLAFRLTYGRGAADRERLAAHRFLKVQQAVYANEKDAGQRIWTDFCQMLFASNGFMYVE